VTRKYFFSERATCTGKAVVKDRDAFVIKAAAYAFACDPRNADIKSPTVPGRMFPRRFQSLRVSLFRLITAFAGGVQILPAQRGAR